VSERDLNSRSFSSFAALAVRILWCSRTARATEDDSPRMAISRRPVFIELVRSAICLSYREGISITP